MAKPLACSRRPQLHPHRSWWSGFLMADQAMLCAQIDSTTAWDLGPSRALLYTGATGEIEKFRPWAMPDADWTEGAAHQIYARFEGPEGGSRGNRAEN